MNAFAEMQRDTRTLRADEAMPALLPLLADSGDPRFREAGQRLGEWDHNMAPDSVAASIFEVFFHRWSRRVAEERFDGELAAALAGSCGGLAAGLLHDDAAGWFGEGDREAAVLAALRAALSDLEDRLGKEMSGMGMGRAAQGAATSRSVWARRPGRTA